VYLGEAQGQRGISYDSRRLEGDGQRFVFQAEAAGTYALNFSKNDFIQDQVLQEQVQVIVEAPEANAGRTGGTTPPASGMPAGTVSAAPEKNVPAETPAQDPPQTAPDYLKMAQEAYTAGKFPDAISLLDKFREQEPAGSAEAWLLYGQSFEANSPSRDIRSALTYYRRLEQEYPQSSHAPLARRRIAYLQRFYFDIQ
jgi:TolA-binding protein